MTTFTTQDRIDAQRTPLSYGKLGELYVQAEKDSFGKCRLKPNGGISLHPTIEEFARAIERAHGIGE
jgi:hypothetical protein